MKSCDYVKACKRTEQYDFTMIQEKFKDNNLIRLLHASMGLETEAGEFTDALKRHVFYNEKLDVVNLKEELGDILWYLAIASDILGTSLEEIMHMNIEKLKKRYEKGFSSNDAIYRNLDIERKTLESEGENNGSK